MVNVDTGELVERTLERDGEKVREFYAALPVLVGIEAAGSMHWFLKLMEELKIECRVGHPAKIREAETRKQKHDRRGMRDSLVAAFFSLVGCAIQAFSSLFQLGARPRFSI